MSAAHSILAGVLFVLIAAGFFGCIVMAISKVWKEQQATADQENGAPEGALNFHFQHPDASASKLSVRVHSKVQSPGGR
jgi:hypothetical protein